MASKLDDYAAQEADVCLTAIMYSRTNASEIQWSKLQEKIDQLKSNIWNGN